MQYVIMTMIGLSLGSFATTCISRLPRKQSLIKPRSFCDSCSRSLGWKELIPLLSYVVLKGRCLKCSAQIPFLYPIVEFLIAILTVVIFIKYGTSIKTPIIILFGLTLLCIVLADMLSRIIPNKLNFTLFITAFVFVWLVSQSGFTAAIVGFFTGLVFTFLPAWFGEHWLDKQIIGGGDIKFTAILGLTFGWEILLVLIWVASVSGLLWVLSRKLIEPKQKITNVPFGAFLGTTALAYILIVDLQ